MTHDMISRLLRKNTSPARIAGFVISNLVGLAIMGVGLQFWLDARSLWNQKDSFLKSDYLAINKIVDASTMLGNADQDFSAEDIGELEAQPWVEKVGRFSKADFRVYASVALGGSAPGDSTGDATPARNMSTAMFFEAVPADFLDLKGSSFTWDSSNPDVPIIISKDYLALYNFGFASSAGLPKLSEAMVSGLPLRLTLASDDGSRRLQLYGHVAGYSNRFNTILVPQEFLDEMNSRLGSGRSTGVSRLIVDVNSPGDAAIAPWLASKGWEQAGDKESGAAAYMLHVVSGIIIAIGSIITLLSLAILCLSMSLLMEKNRRKLHSLLMLGFPVKDVARPYWHLTAISAITAGVLALGCVLLLRNYYLAPLQSLGAEGDGLVWTILMLTLLTLVIIFINSRMITRRVLKAWSK
ncbi:MAG: ABC transporter permease [Muribaculaceae bacterium]|nr:ABC transporter permease [Muribaculaceae bacterium]